MKIPFTLWSSTYEPVGTLYTFDWNGLVNKLQWYASRPYARKEDAPLFNLLAYEGCYRNRESARVCGGCVLDFDNDADWAPVKQKVIQAGIAAVGYSTASNKGNVQKFRLVVPYAELLDVNEEPNNEMTLTWDSLDEYFGLVKRTDDFFDEDVYMTDASKCHGESHFYVPGQYFKANNWIEVFDGDIFTAQQWRDAVYVEKPRQKWRINVRRELTPIQQYRRDRKQREYEHTLLFQKEEQPLMIRAIEEAYFDLSGEQRYPGRISILFWIVRRARGIGYPLTEEELVGIYNDLDTMHPEGPRHQTPDKQRSVRHDVAKAFREA